MIREKNRIGWMALIALMLISIAHSCKTTEITSGKVIKDVRVKDLASEADKRKNSIDGIWVKKVKGSLKYANDTYTFKANYRVKRDSVIIISIMSPVGIEAFRILCKTDSFGFMDRINREYYYGPYSTLNKKVGYHVSYNFLQSILLNEIATEEEETKQQFFKKNKRLEVTDNRIKVMLEESSEEEFGKRKVKYDMEFNAAILNLIKSRIWDEKYYSEIEIDYEDFREINSIWFPGIMDIKIKNSQNPVGCRLEMDRITIGTDFNTNFTISQKYKRIEW